MPNKQPEADAKAFYEKWKTPKDPSTLPTLAFAFAAAFVEQYAAEQIAAERVRIADELERITNGSSCEINLLIQELREAK